MSLGKDRYYQAEGGYEDSDDYPEELNMKGINGDYAIKKKQFSTLCSLDNHWKAEIKDHPDMILSAQMIVEKFGGQEGIMQALFTNPKTGIEGSSEDIQDRQRIYGVNRFPKAKIKGICELIFENFEDRINQILLVAALVSLVIGLYKEGFPTGLIEGTSIAIALVIICTVTSVNNYYSEKRLADLYALSNKQFVAVFRNSDKAVTIDSEELVVGDLVGFETGEKVPADMMMVEGQDTQCNQSDLTGETGGLNKCPVSVQNYRDGVESIMLASSTIENGFGRAIVLAVGYASQSGIISAASSGEGQDSQTLLQKKLEIMAGKIGNIGIAAALATILASVLRIILETTNVLPCGCQNMFVCQIPIEGSCKPYDFYDISNAVYPMLLDAVIIGITVVVVAIPEGLPLAVTIALSFSSKKMEQLNNLVREIASAETMGGATHICTDKTGTLTKNEMTVMATMAIEKVIQSEGSGEEEMAGFIAESKRQFENLRLGSQTIWDILYEGVLWNSSAWLELQDKKREDDPDEYVPKGNVTEQGIIKYFVEATSADDCVDKKAELTEDKIQCIIPFSSKRKMGSVVIKVNDKIGTDKEIRVYTKGAPDMLLERCTYVTTADGFQQMEAQTAVPKELIDAETEVLGETMDSHMGIYQRTIKKFASQAYRTIMVCYRDMSMREFTRLKHRYNQFATDEDRANLEQELIAVGIFGLQDPLRETIVESIQQCYTAGIQVIMCTGDNIDTAIAISKNAGIVDEEEIKRNQYSCMTGKEFREAVGGLKPVELQNGQTIKIVGDMDKFREIKGQLKVLARSSPEDKLILVTGIQDSGGVVAVTGDGTNDAPALTKSDVGFSMGVTGTDVAKMVSDIILLDDNFSSIIVALKFGRNVYDNVRKFIQFQLTVNYVAMFIVFLGAVVTKKAPLNAVQMLWVNLIMDTFAALALATEPPPAGILERKPYKKDNAIITDIMSRNVLGHAVYQIIVLLVLLFAGPKMLIDHPFEKQCTKYDAAGQCDKAFLNPYYTTTLYYEPALWRDLTVAAQQDIETEATVLLPGLQFDAKLLWAWRCNMFTQEHPEWAAQVAALELCKLEDETKLEAIRVKAGAADYKMIEALENSVWLKLDPATEGLTIPAKGDVPETTYSSRGFATEQVKLFTLIFNAFVFMQVFNQINARKLEADEMNVFAGLFANVPFLLVMVVTIGVQVLMIAFGGRMVKCWPLNFSQNLLCILIGAGELPWGLLVKFIPLGIVPKISLEDKALLEGEKKVFLSTALKKKGRKTDSD